MSRKTPRPGAGDPAPPKAAYDLIGELGEDVARRMIEAFRGEAPKQIRNMRRALANQDCRTVAEAAHSLGGPAAYLGAAMLARRCRELEEMAQLEDVGGCRAGIDDIEEEYRKLVEKLASSATSV